MSGLEISPSYKLCPTHESVPGFFSAMVLDKFSVKCSVAKREVVNKIQSTIHNSMR